MNTLKTITTATLLLFSIFAFAQNKEHKAYYKNGKIQSSGYKTPFAATKNYLHEIQATVNYAPHTKKQKIAKLNEVISQATKQQDLLEKQIKTVKNEKGRQQIIREFKLILQAVALLKRDINENVRLSEDIEYLNHNIPILLRKLK